MRKTLHCPLTEALYLTSQQSLSNIQIHLQISPDNGKQYLVCKHEAITENVHPFQEVQMCKFYENHPYFDIRGRREEG